MLAVIFALAVLLSGCGQYAEAPAPAPIPFSPINPNEPADKPIVAAWGAPWCGICKAELPRLQAELDRVGSKAEFILYVPTGATATQPPTMEVATKYRDYLKLKAKVVLDPKWALFKQHVSKQLAIPAGLVQKELKVTPYPPGSFDARAMAEQTK